MVPGRSARPEGQFGLPGTTASQEKTCIPSREAAPPLQG